jgi:hypothetical protein
VAAVRAFSRMACLRWSLGIDAFLGASGETAGSLATDRLRASLAQKSVNLPTARATVEGGT